MITRNNSTLVVLGRDGATAADDSATTGLIPTTATEAGETPERGCVRPYSVWHLRAESEAEDEDESGFSSLRSLLARVVPAAAALHGLAARYEVRIDWGGFSDSSQGGFVLEPDIARELADLGLPLYGTACIG